MSHVVWQTAFLMRSCTSTWTLLFSTFEVDNCRESYIMLKVGMSLCTSVASHPVPPAKHVRKNTLWLPLATAAARKAKGEFACRKWRKNMEKPQTPSGWIKFNNNVRNCVDVDSQLGAPHHNPCLAVKDLTAWLQPQTNEGFAKAHLP